MINDYRKDGIRWGINQFFIFYCKPLIFIFILAGYFYVSVEKIFFSTVIQMSIYYYFNGSDLKNFISSSNTGSFITDSNLNPARTDYVNFPVSLTKTYNCDSISANGIGYSNLVGSSINNTYSAYSLEYTTSGSYSYTIPSYFNKLSAICIGGGGGGGGGCHSSNNQNGGPGSGGASGAFGYIEDVPLNSIVDRTITINVGERGLAGSSLPIDGTQGGLSSITMDSKNVLTCNGGGGGKRGNRSADLGPGTGATGGTASTYYNTLYFNSYSFSTPGTASSNDGADNAGIANNTYFPIIKSTKGVQGGWNSINRDSGAGAKSATYYGAGGGAGGGSNASGRSGNEGAYGSGGFVKIYLK